MYNLLYYSNLLSVCFLICGCEEMFQTNNTASHPEILNIDVRENLDPYFFPTNHTFNITEKDLVKIENILRDFRADGIENISFMLVSDQFIPVSLQEKVKNKIISMMYKFGFINSRIIDSGTCVYKDAKPGIRINALKYTIKETDCSQWSESIGDIDVAKDLPKTKAATNYNLEAMIANPADLIVPRKYQGQKADAAITALATKASSGDSGFSTSGSTSSSS